MPPLLVPVGADGFTYKCPHKLRTYADQAHAAHEFAHEFETAFECPCCNEKITRENYDAKKKAMTKAKREKHIKTHGGQKFGCRPVFPVDMEDTYICACHARKNLTGRLFQSAICQRIKTDTQAQSVHDYITKELRIDMPKSFCKKKSKKIVEWNRIPSFQGQEDDKILYHFIDILLKVCDPEKEMDKGHFDKSIEVLLRLIDWRNAVYHRIGTPFPTKEKLKAKHERVSRKANALYEAWVSAFKKATPYLHAILHNEAYLHVDVVDRSAEALEHLNKIMKSITKRGLKRCPRFFFLYITNTHTQVH